VSRQHPDRVRRPHALITKVCGQFVEFEGSAHLDGDDPSQSQLQGLPLADRDGGHGTVAISSPRHTDLPP
jgi:hypothetical protein